MTADKVTQDSVSMSNSPAPIEALRPLQAKLDRHVTNAARNFKISTVTNWSDCRDKLINESLVDVLRQVCRFFKPVFYKQNRFSSELQLKCPNKENFRCQSTGADVGTHPLLLQLLASGTSLGLFVK